MNEVLLQYQTSENITIFKKRENISSITKYQNQEIKQKVESQKIEIIQNFEKKTLNYTLQLFKIMRIHSIFHVSLLKKANQNVKIYQTEI